MTYLLIFSVTCTDYKGDSLSSSIEYTVDCAPDYLSTKIAEKKSFINAKLNKVTLGQDAIASVSLAQVLPL